MRASYYAGASSLASSSPCAMARSCRSCARPRISTCAGALEPGEASGGTFTIASLDAGALWLGVPLIGQPQSAFLGIGATVERPLVIDVSGVDRIVVRPTTVLTLAYDARVLDQCHADAFLRAVKERLECFAA